MTLSNPLQYLQSQGYTKAMIAFEMNSNECSIDQVAADVFAAQEAYVEQGYSHRDAKLLTYSF